MRLLPLAGGLHSKSKVNDAGRLFAEHLQTAEEGNRRVGQQRAELLEAVQIIDWWRGEHAKPLSRVAANLRYHAEQEAKPIVTQRLKKFSTIVGKLLREPGMKLARMEDIGGVRAVLPDQDAAYRVASRLRKNWTITRVRDYVAEPKADGYRALHLINRNRGRLIEVQLRTPLQDAWANMVEADARLFAPDLKFGGGPRELTVYYAVLGAIFALADEGRLPLDPTSIDQAKDLERRADTFKGRSK